MRGRERRRRSFDELGLLRICQRDSPLHLLYPERRRLFRRCRRFSRGVVSFRFSQCRLRGRHQPGGQPAVMAGHPRRFRGRGRVELGTLPRHRRRPQGLRASSPLSVPDQKHGRKLAGYPRLAAVADPFTGVWIYDSKFVGWRAVGGANVSTPIWACIVNAAGRFNNSTVAEHTEIYASSSLFQEGSGVFTDITPGACGIGPDFESLLATEG